MIIFNETKTINLKTDLVYAETKYIFDLKVNNILLTLKNYTKEDLDKLIKKDSFNLYESYQNYKNIKPCILSYNGLSFKSLNIDSINYSKDYLNSNLRILSSLYGVLKPFDLIGYYRLDFSMNKDLYKYWSNDITEYFNNLKCEYILNLCSLEYSKLLDRKNLECKVIDVEFLTNGLNKPTYSKQARGLMLRELTLNNITNLDDIKNLEFDSYKLNSSKSSETLFVFER